jgi:phosphoglycerate dehydrogenase-like enzyme
VCCGLNTETHNLFGAEEFKLMKETAVITTVARGAIINSNDLVEALQSGAIGGAGLDVTDPEPLTPGHPLWTTPNTIITPHASGHSPHAGRRLELLVIENIKRFAVGNPHKQSDLWTNQAPACI